MPKSGCWKILPLGYETRWKIRLFNSVKWTTRFRKLRGSFRVHSDAWTIWPHARDVDGFGTLCSLLWFFGFLWSYGGFGDEFRGLTSFPRLFPTCILITTPKHILQLKNWSIYQKSLEWIHNNDKIICKIHRKQKTTEERSYGSVLSLALPISQIIRRRR